MGRVSVVVTSGGARDWPVNTIVVPVVCGGGGGFVHVVFYT